MSRPPQSIKMPGISPEEAEAITAEFHGLDKDGNGEVSVDELEAVLRSMRIKLLISETEIKQTMRKIDSNGDGVIQMSELNGVLEKYDTKGTVYKALTYGLKYAKNLENMIKTKVDTYQKKNCWILLTKELEQMLQQNNWS